MRLEGKVAIITGVSGDGQVGQAVAQAFAREGAKLVLVARRAEKVNARAEEARALGAEVLAVAMDGVGAPLIYYNRDYHALKD
jgi:NAD(P)-dependent dehydrogenase (short-subunit alcohol dehydrogenase family)